MPAQGLYRQGVKIAADPAGLGYHLGSGVPPRAAARPGTGLAPRMGDARLVVKMVEEKFAVVGHDQQHGGASLAHTASLTSAIQLGTGPPKDPGLR